MQNPFGSELVVLREAAGLTLRELASHLGVDHTYLSHIESGRRKPPEHLVEKVARFFDVSGEALMLKAGHVPEHLMVILQERPEAAIRALEDISTNGRGVGERWYLTPDDLLETRGDSPLTLPGLDSYDRPPFATHIEAGKNTSIYSAHSYHTKVPYQGIIPYLEHYTEPGDLVLDPFCGSGMTGVAAILTGRDAILYDISPAAVHIARNYTTPCDSHKLEEAYRQLTSDLSDVERGLYSTVCKQCGGEARIEYTVFTDILECDDCQGEVSVWSDGRDEEGKIRSSVTCPSCGTDQKRNGLNWLRSEPCLINMSCREACTSSRMERKPTQEDRERLSEVASSSPPGWVPSRPFGPEWEMWRKGHEDRGITNVKDFFTPRNLHGLSAVHDWIEGYENPRISAALMYAFTGCVNRASKRYQWNHKRPTNVLSGTLYVSSLFYEFNVFRLFERKLKATVRLFRSTAAATGNAAVEEGSATDLSDIPSNSVDYVFTDPPFGSNIFYADCSLLWEAWLDSYTEAEKEIVVSRSEESAQGGKTLEDYRELLTEALVEVRRVLKPNRWASVVFHNSNADVWRAVRQACIDAGFTLGSAVMFDKQQKSFKALKGAKGEERVANYDVVLNLQKRPPVVEQVSSPARSEAHIVEWVRDHLASLDQTDSEERSTAYLHSLAVQEALSEELNFDSVDLSTFTELLDREFDEETGKWYLREPVAEAEES